MKNLKNVTLHSDPSEKYIIKEKNISATPIRKQISETLANESKIKSNLKRFLEHMALSNTVKPFYENNVLKYQADSAEELAMVQFANSVNYKKVGENPTKLIIKEDFEKQHIFRHIATLGFSSKRARVTVIYEDQEGKIRIMTKGQDSVILPLLEHTYQVEKIEAHINEMYASGLRTLVLAYAECDRKWWSQWKDEYNDLLSNREMPEEKYKKKKHELYEEIEKSAKLTYLGLMGLEDQLQDFVPECIEDFFHAGIKVWMLTGDKLPAAKNIAIATNLIEPEIHLVRDVDNSKSNEDALKAFRQRKLVEITGKWSNFPQDSEKLDIFWKTFCDKNGVNVPKVESQQITMHLKNHDAPSEFLSLFPIPNKEITKQTFRETLSKFKFDEKKSIEHELQIGKKLMEDQSKENKISLLVNRQAFGVIFSNENESNLGKKFMDISLKSKSVVFAQAHPSMKKKMVVEIRKRRPTAITLAIGDGANDTDMIQAAHLGIGIAGVEGTAAVSAADYALGEFQMLHTLLFVHGFWNFRRIAYLVNYVSYKAMLRQTPIIFWGFYRYMTTTKVWDTVSTMFYNGLYTSFPIIAIALFDQRFSRRQLEDDPSLYKDRKMDTFNGRIFFTWMFRSIFHGSLVFFITKLCLDELGHGAHYIALTMFTTLVSLVTFISFLDMHSINFITIITVLISYGSLWMVLPLEAMVPGNQNYGPLQNLFTDTPIFFFLWFLMSTTPTFLEMLYRNLINPCRTDNKRRNNMKEKILVENENAEEQRLLQF